MKQETGLLHPLRLVAATEKGGRNVAVTHDFRSAGIELDRLDG